MSGLIIVEPMLKHPGHPDQKVHAGKRGGAHVSGSLDPTNHDDLRAAFEQTIYDHNGDAYQIKVDRVLDFGASTHVNGTIVDANGERAGSFQRVIEHQQGTVYNAALEIREPYRERGIATEFQKASEHAALSLGMDKITVLASQDGSKAWASERFGFEFAAPPKHQLNSTRRWAENQGDASTVASIDSMLSRFEGDRSSWPRPHEVLAMGVAGERVLKQGWDGQKPASRVTKQAAEAMFYVTVLGVDEPAAKSLLVLEPVVKHPGHPDQKVHGHRHSGAVSPEVAAKTLELVRANGGLSIKMTDGSEPPAGYMVARESSKFGTVVSAADFYDPEKGPQILAEHLIRNRSELGSGRAYLGVWHQTEENLPDGTKRALPWDQQRIHLDVTDQIMDRERAVRLGRRRDQISVWDVANFEEIPTGGKGGSLSKRQAVAGVSDAEAPERDDRRGDSSVGAGAVGAARRAAVVVLPVVKHPGHPDQKVHGHRGLRDAGGNVERARETGESMGLGFPCPSSIAGVFADARAGNSDTAGEALMHVATNEGAREGLDEYDPVHADETDAALYGQAVYMRAESLRVQDRTWDKRAPGEAEATHAMVDDVRENGTVCVATDPDSAMAILSEGRFASQFETDTSRGALNPDARARGETMMFDTHPSVAPEHRPIYGYVASDGTQIGSGGVAQYGDVRFVLHDSVRERTTMTVGDSLSTYAFPVHMNGAVTEREAWNSVARNSFMSAAHAHSVGARSFQQRSYFEAQVHGGVQVSDVARIHLMGSRDDWHPDLTQELIDLAGEHGIPVVFDE